MPSEGRQLYSATMCINRFNIATPESLGNRLTVEQHCNDMSLILHASFGDVASQLIRTDIYI